VQAADLGGRDRPVGGLHLDPLCAAAPGANRRSSAPPHRGSRTVAAVSAA